MAVKISGVLKDGTGKPVQNCTIQLKAKRNSTTVVVNTLASENPDEAGRYSMDVEYGQYSVILLVEGFPPSHAGTITVYEDSQPGTLNDFLGAMTEDDARPEALRRFELMVEEVARNASAVAQNTAAAKKSASDASTSASEAATHATDAADSARAASTSAGQAASSAQSASCSAGTASTKASEASKSAAAAESSKSEAAASAGAAKTSEMNAAASATAAGKSAESASSSATTATAKATEATSQATAAKDSASAAKTSETNAKTSEDNAASSKAAAAESASSASASATSASASKDEAIRQASAAKGSATTASTKATEAAGSATAAAQSKSTAESAATRAETAAKRAEDIASAVGLEDASTTQKGLVQLSSETNSDSETMAATPKAVKAVKELADTRAPTESPSLTGTPTSPTAAQGTNSTQIANTAFVKAAITALINGAPGTLDTLKEIAAAINNDPNFSTTINNALALKAPLASPALTGIPTAPTAAQGTNNTQIATTAYVRAAISALVGSSPEALDTLNELAAALGNDPNFATTMTNALAGKQPLDATLTALAGLATGANKLPYFTGTDTVSQTDLTSVGRDILAKTSVLAVIQYLGLRELGTSGEKIPLLSTANTWSEQQNFQNGAKGDLTGNADTATKLQNPVKINGVEFDGSKDVTVSTDSLPLIKTSLSLTTDLNTLGDPNTSPGGYFQRSATKATTAKNYPLDGVGGALVVIPSGNGCTQEFTTQGITPTRRFIRSLTGDWNGSDGPWGEWVETGASVDAYTKSESDASYVTGIRLGSVSTVSMSGTSYSASGGRVLTGLYRTTSSWGMTSGSYGYFRQIQYCIGGKWYSSASL